MRQRLIVDAVLKTINREMANTNLANAKTAKNDEFYTQYADIQKEINAYLDYDPNVFRGKLCSEF